MRRNLLAQGHTRWKLLVGLLLVLALSLAMVVLVRAQGSQPWIPSDDEVNAVAKQLYCPVCPNTPLDVCETKACQDWRAQIRDQLTAGWTQDQVIVYFVQQYGERVLAEPKRAGFNSLIWMLPVLVVLLGATIVFQVLKSWRRTSQSSVFVPVSKERISAEALRQIEQELQEID